MSTTVVTDNAASYFQALNPGSFQQVTFNSGSLQSQAMDDSTTIVKLFSTQDCWVAFGANPTAAAGTPGTKGSAVMLRGGIVEYFGVPKGQKYKVAVIQDAQGGILDITEGA